MSALPYPDYLHRLLERIALQQGFSSFTIHSESGSNNGDGFMAIMLRVRIEGTRNNQPNSHLSLICKVQPLNEQRRLMGAGAFRQEIYAYEHLLPQIVDFQRSRGLRRPADGFYTFPKCYGTYSNAGTHEYAVVLEDLRPQGVRMWNKLDDIDYAHARLVLAEMGKLHAISFAFRDQQPSRLDEYRRIESGMAQQSTHPAAKDFYDGGFDRAAALLTEPKDQVLREKMLRLKAQYAKILGQVTAGAEAEPFAVLNHGDFWNNNTMFRYPSAESRQVQGVVLIDWQMGQFCSPATDISYYLYSSTNQVLRDNLWDALLHVYYDSFSQQLRALGSYPDQLFTFADLQQQMRDFAIYGLIFATMLTQMMTLKPDEIPDLDKLTADSGPEEFSFLGKSDELYRRKMAEIMRDFEARGFFESKFFIA